MNSEGIGLGLMISKKIVELNEGQINVHSKGIGEGSIFIFSMRMDMLQRQEEIVSEVEIVEERNDDIEAQVDNYLLKSNQS